MKIFNYSDTPVMVDGKLSSEVEICLTPTFPRQAISHNGFMFVHNSASTTQSNNAHYYITNHRNGNGYRYKVEEYAVPNIFLWASIFFMFCGTFFLIRVIQKIKTR